jgi:hypothetical protein
VNFKIHPCSFSFEYTEDMSNDNKNNKNRYRELTNENIEHMAK